MNIIRISPKINFIYNTSGNLIEEDWFNEENIIYQKFIYQYDENSNLIDATVYNTKGGMLFFLSWSSSSLLYLAKGKQSDNDNQRITI
jgi:hypothetical protein